MLARLAVVAAVMAVVIAVASRAWGMLPALIKPAAAVLVLLLFLPTLVIAEGWITYNPSPPSGARFNTIEGAQTGRAIVFLTALSSSAEVTSRALLPLLLSYGDVVLVDYEPGFRPRLLFDQLQKRLGRQYRSVMLYGVSLGGLLSAQFYRRSAAQLPIDGIVAVDSPTRAGDIKLPLRLFRYVKPGWLLSKSWPALRQLADKLMPVYKENGVDPEHLRKHQRFMWHHPVKDAADQLAAITDSPGLDQGELAGVRVAIVDSIGNDPIVEDDALKCWQEASPSHRLIEGGRGHATVIEEPAAARRYTHEAMEFIWGRPAG
ncbi:hypothetical protein KY386_00990 [Candidatus Parcubacteria bacterium]|nr:hypothetical protein [Candidatus Parcubacteria bacterium]